MAGLPGTGKSTLAARLAEEIGAVVLNKDHVRAALFPPPTLDYSTAQDDLVMAAVYGAAAYILRASPRQPVILDGRTFLRNTHLEALLAAADSMHERPHIIECTCADEIARARLERDLTAGQHPAGNRTYALYLARKAAAEPIPTPHLVLDTGQLSLEACVQRSLEYLGG